ncbi:MAG: ABC transporter ATP-binding protein [Desulfobacca sp.]|nr:ABC transporter ATP-binding protein [Desulfobacca sp.]
MNLLEVKNLAKRFGGLMAVNDLDFSIREGEIVGLIGPNGAGKTTVFNMIAGMFHPTHGEIAFKGKKIHHLKTSTIAQLGIIRTFQLTNLFGDMTVMQNVIIGSHQQLGINVWSSLLNTRSARRDEVKANREADAILAFMGLAGYHDILAKNLTHGLQRRLEVAIALAAKPTLFLLDEPLQGMNREEVKGMLDCIAEIRRQGKTILLVEHNMKAVMSICEKVVVLNFGQKIDEGSPQMVMQNPEVIEAYLGVEE